MCLISCGRNATYIYREELTSRFVIALGLLSMMENMFVNDEINNEKTTSLYNHPHRSAAFWRSLACSYRGQFPLSILARAPVRKAPAGRSSSMGQSPTALATSIVVLMARRLIWANGPATILPALVLKPPKTPYQSERLPGQRDYGRRAV